MDAIVSIDEIISKDLSHLQTLSDESALDLLQIIMEFMIYKKSSNFQTALAAYSANGEMPLAALKAVARSAIVIFEGAMKEGWSASVLHLECASRYKLNPSSCDNFKMIWTKNANHIASRLLEKTIAANELVDVDWSFGVTASSSDCDQVRYGHLCMFQ